MLKPVALYPVVLLAFALIALVPQSADAQNTTERLRTSVARMNHWLGSGAKAQAWRKALDLNVLDSQAAKGEQADPETLRTLLSLMEKDHPSLKHPVIQEVRSSVKAQIAQIDRTRTQELADQTQAALQAVSQFTKPTASRLEVDRDLAKYELQVLKKVYRRDYDSRSRAIVFHKLKLDQTIEMLENLKIEMPPEVSVGKMRSMINDERERLEAIVDEIDALPIALPEEDEDTDSDSDNDDDSVEIVLSPPGPDDDSEDDLKSLEAKQEAVEERIKELRNKYADVLEEDRPRLLRRRDAGRELRRAQRRFRSLAKEQTGPAFVSAQIALDRFVDSFEFGTEDNIQQEYLERVTELAKLIPDLNDPNARLSHAKIGDILHWLEHRQQLRDLCVAIRRRYSNPNAYVTISSRMIRSLTTRSSAEYDRVAEDFLGRFARGLSFTDTTASVATIDDPDQVHVSILLNGTATADTYVRELSFRINSNAAGQLSARRDLFANLNGLWATESDVDALMSTQFGGISTNCGLIQRLAQKSFGKEKGKADAESTRRVKNRLQERFDTETSSAIEDGVSQIESAATLSRKFAAFLPQVFFRSFSDRVEAVAKKDTRSSIGAVVNPTFRTAGSDIQVKLHDSMLSNYLDLVFAGRTFSQSDLEAELKSYAGDMELFPAGDSDEDAEEVEEFKISFPKIRPIQVEFFNNRLGVTITGSKFEQGDNAIKTKLAIKLTFKVVNRNGKLFLIPEGTPKINLSEGEEPDAESIAFAKILEDRLGDEVKKSGDTGFELPPNLLPSIKQLEGVDLIKSLHLGLFEFNDGWLYLGWNYQAGSVSTPAIWNEVVVQDFDPIYRPNEEDKEDENLSSESALVPQLTLPGEVVLEPIVLESVLQNVETGMGQ